MLKVLFLVIQIIHHGRIVVKDTVYQALLFALRPSRNHIALLCCIKKSASSQILAAVSITYEPEVKSLYLQFRHQHKLPDKLMVSKDRVVR